MTRAPLGAGEVRVRVLEGGICGTDRDVASGRYGRAPEGESFLILGHENLGEVLEAGGGVAGFSPGDLVVATVRRGCGLCRFCAANRSDFCESGKFTERGISGRHGYFAEEYVEIPQYLVHVPAQYRSTAVLLEPLSVVEKAVEEGEKVLRRKEPTPGALPPRTPTALVAGTGAIGILGALLLRSKGYEVTAIDRHDDATVAAGLLRATGARHVNTAGGLGALGDATFDLVLEATGNAMLDLALVRTLDRNAVLVLTGIPDPSASASPEGEGSLLRDLVLENQAIVGSVNANRTFFERGVEDLARFESRWPGLLPRVIGSRVPLAACAAALSGRAPAATIKTAIVIGADGGREESGSLR